MTALPRALIHHATRQTVRPGALLAADTMEDVCAGAFLVQESGHERLSDLRRAVAAGFAGVALSGCRQGEALQRLAVLMDVAEAEEGMADGALRILWLTDGILPAPADLAAALAITARRLAGLVWDHGALVRTLGARRCETEAGNWTAPFAAARAAALLAGRAAGLPVYDSAEPHEPAIFAGICERSRDDGFYGCLAATTEQIAVIERLYAVR